MEDYPLDICHLLGESYGKTTWKHHWNEIKSKEIQKYKKLNSICGKWMKLRYVENKSRNRMCQIILCFSSANLHPWKSWGLTPNGAKKQILNTNREIKINFITFTILENIIFKNVNSLRINVKLLKNCNINFQVQSFFSFDHSGLYHSPNLVNWVLLFSFLPIRRLHLLLRFHFNPWKGDDKNEVCLLGTSISSS